MYIKKVRKNNGRTKQVYEYLHLVESVRTDKGPRQRLVLNLGPLEIDPSFYGPLARRIEDMLTGQESLYPLDSSLEQHAQDAVRTILRKQGEDIYKTQTTDYQQVDINSIEAEDSRSIGAEHIAHAVWQELGMPSLLRNKGISTEAMSIITTLVIGRLVEPASELHTWKWAAERSAVYELVEFPSRVSLTSFYRTADTVLKHKDAIEQHLSHTEKSLFSLTEQMFLFDLTNTYFEGKAMRNPKARYGRSKEKRSDCKLVTLGLVVDELGFAKTTKIFPGNQSEPQSLETMIGSLKQTMNRDADKSATIVIDAGIATQSNLEYLRSENLHYIAVNRGKVPVPMDEIGMTVIRNDPTTGIKLEVKRFVHEGEAYVLCKSEMKKKKEAGIRGRVEELLLEKLARSRDGLSRKHHPKKFSKIVEVVGRLKEKYPKAAKLYEIEVVPEKNKSADNETLLAIDIKWKKKDAYEIETHAEGNYVLRTDRLDLSDSEIWNLYVMITRIEHAFRCMKSSLGLRPNFHQVEHRVDAHLFISVLAYHILHTVEHRLRMAGMPCSWATVRDIMSTHTRFTISFKTKSKDNNEFIQFIRLNTKPTADQFEIYRCLNVSPIPLPRKKFIKT